MTRMSAVISCQFLAFSQGTITTQTSFPRWSLFDYCANSNSAHQYAMGTIHAVSIHLCWRRSRSNGTSKENQMKLKTSAVVGAFSLMLFIAGCQAASQTPGPTGPQGEPGATGQAGDPGRDSDRQRAEDQKRADDQRRADEQRGADKQRGADDQRQAGEQRRLDDQKRADNQKREADRTREGHDLACPAGEHRYTNPNSGVVSCVRD
jgi:hypothetical protein